jgi:hypothetical protein
VVLWSTDKIFEDKQNSQFYRVIKEFTTQHFLICLFNHIIMRKFLLFSAVILLVAASWAQGKCLFADLNFKSLIARIIIL